MSHIIEQAEELRSKAIALLLMERGAIDEQLRLLGHDGIATTNKQAKQKVCGICMDASHNARTCPKTKGPLEAPIIQPT
jgi:hypothetical protein